MRSTRFLDVCVYCVLALHTDDGSCNPAHFAVHGHLDEVAAGLGIVHQLIRDGVHHGAIGQMSDLLAAFRGACTESRVKTGSACVDLAHNAAFHRFQGVKIQFLPIMSNENR